MKIILVKQMSYSNETKINNNRIKINYFFILPDK